MQTVRRTDGHSDDHLENMTSHTKVWRDIKFGSVPFRKILIHRGDYYFAERNGTKKKDTFLEKSEMFLIIYDLQHLKIVHACVQPVSIQARHAKDQCTCMSNLKNIRQYILKLFCRNKGLTDSQTDSWTQRRSTGNYDMTH